MCIYLTAAWHHSILPAAAAAQRAPSRRCLYALRLYGMPLRGRALSCHVTRLTNICMWPRGGAGERDGGRAGEREGLEQLSAASGLLREAHRSTLDCIGSFLQQQRARRRALPQETKHQAPSTKQRYRGGACSRAEKTQAPSPKPAPTENARRMAPGALARGAPAPPWVDASRAAARRATSPAARAVASWGPPGGPLEKLMEAYWAVLGASWGNAEPSWGPLGPVWGCALLGPARRNSYSRPTRQPPLDPPQLSLHSRPTRQPALRQRLAAPQPRQPTPTTYDLRQRR